MAFGPSTQELLLSSVAKGVTRVKVNPLTARAASLHPTRPRPSKKSMRADRLDLRQTPLDPKERPELPMRTPPLSQSLSLKPREYTQPSVEWQDAGKIGR